MCLRSGQKHSARTPAKYPISGVLDIEVMVITEAEMMPRSAEALAFLLCHQSPRNRGSNVAPKVPARIGCANGPWDRNLPSRTKVNSGTPPNTENRFRPVNCSVTMQTARTVQMKANTL